MVRIVLLVHLLGRGRGLHEIGSIRQRQGHRRQRQMLRLWSSRHATRHVRSVCASIWRRVRGRCVVIRNSLCYRVQKRTRGGLRAALLLLTCLRITSSVRGMVIGASRSQSAALALLVISKGQVAVAEGCLLGTGALAVGCGAPTACDRFLHRVRDRRTVGAVARTQHIHRVLRVRIRDHGGGARASFIAPAGARALR